MEALPDSVLQLLLLKCGGPQDVARCACVARRWRSAVSDDGLWKELCHLHFGLACALPCDPSLAPCASFREAYRKWHAQYSFPLRVRVKNLWETLQQWATVHFPDVISSFLPGASEEDLDAVEDALGWSLPKPVRLLYRFFNGQNVPSIEEFPYMNSAAKPNYVGLLGGYHFYHHFVNVHLLPIQQACTYTQRLLPLWYIGKDSKLLIIAVSCKLNKFFFLDGNDGMVYVGMRRLATDEEMMPCVPKTVEGGNDLENGHDSMLRWLEEYARQLTAGMFAVQNHCGSSSITLFPEKEPLCSEAITSGVQVRCSAVFVPELSAMEEDEEEDEDENFLFCYSVRMRLLASGEGPYHHTFSTCQLSRRHWQIQAKSETNEPMILPEVDGEAVIGEYPVLQVGAEPFVYASCTPLPTALGSMEGGFTFVPGSLSRSQGANFYAIAARFPLQVPKFIF